MATELFANDPTLVGSAWSTLASGITNVATAPTIASNTPYPAADPTASPATQFRVRIDNEILLVTDNRTTTWTVTRAQESTTGASHSSGAAVTVVFTAASVATLQDGVEVTSFNTRTGAVTLSKADVTSTGLAAADVGADASGAAAAVQALAALKANNLSDLANAATARTNLGLGSAATHASTDFDTAGAAAAVEGLPLGLTGATQATRYVGGTTTGAPSTGTFAVGDFVVTADSNIFICTVAGTPGTWAQSGSGTYGALAGATWTGTQNFTGATVTGISAKSAATRLFTRMTSV